MLEKKRPLVFVGRIPPGVTADVVATDIFAGTRAGVAHLASRGHRRVGLITVEKSMSVSDARVAGWKQALRSRKLPADEALIVKTELSTEAGRAAAAQLLELAEPPTAIFADNLVITTGVLKALQEKRLECPKDVELVSSDDAEWLDVFHPPISTIVQPSYEVGAKAAEVLLKRIKHPKRAAQIVLLEPQLKIRT